MFLYSLPPLFLPVFGIIKCYHLIFLFLLPYLHIILVVILGTMTFIFGLL